MSMPESRTIPLLIKEQARRFASNEALIDGTRRYTYAQLLDETNSVARGLLAIGVTRGDRVAILMGNRAEWLITFLAIQQIGAVSVGMNTWSSARELEYTLSHAEVSCLVAADRLRSQDFRAAIAGIRGRDHRKERRAQGRLSIHRKPTPHEKVVQDGWWNWSH